MIGNPLTCAVCRLTDSQVRFQPAGNFELPLCNDTASCVSRYEATRQKRTCDGPTRAGGD